MLQTNLKHILTAEEHLNFINENENVMICCGLMGPMCTPVYATMSILQNKYIHVKFADMYFKNIEAHVIRRAPECKGFKGLPFTIYYKNGKVVKATTSIQTKEQVTTILDEYFGKS